MIGDGLWNAAAEATRKHGIGARFTFIRMPKPWYWVFTFWKSKWLNYGRFDKISPNDPRFADAQYETVPVFQND